MKAYYLEKRPKNLTWHSFADGFLHQRKSVNRTAHFASSLSPQTENLSSLQLGNKEKFYKYIFLFMEELWKEEEEKN